jgi:GAF domain
VLVPERFWEAHLAGFTQYLLTREERVFGRPLLLPAATRDGGEVLVELVISVFAWNDRPTFVARLRDRSDNTDRDRSADRSVALAVVNEVSVLLALSGDAPLAVVAPKMLAAIGEGLGWEVGSLWLAGPDRLAQRVWWQAGAGYDEFREATVLRSFALYEGLPGRVQATLTPVWLGDLDADASFARRQAAVASGLRVGFAFPVSFRNRCLGVVEFFATQRRDPDDDLLAVIDTLGLHLGLYLGHHPEVPFLHPAPAGRSTSGR